MKSLTQRLTIILMIWLALLVVASPTQAESQEAPHGVSGITIADLMKLHANGGEEAAFFYVAGAVDATSNWGEFEGCGIHPKMLLEDVLSTGLTPKRAAEVSAGAYVRGLVQIYCKLGAEDSK